LRVVADTGQELLRTCTKGSAQNKSIADAADPSRLAASLVG
jgi:hypothetical protein